MAKKSKLNLINDDLTWNADRRYKVNSVVQLNGEDYQNITGKNSNPELLIDWQELLSPTSVDQTIIDGSTNAVSGNAVFDALEILDENIKNSGNYLPEQGLIIFDDFNRATLGSDYTSYGTASFSVVSNRLQISRYGALSLSNYIVWNAYGNSNIEAYTMSCKVVAGTIDSASYGFGFTFQSNMSGAAGFSVQIGFALDSGNLGKISLYYQNNIVPKKTSLNGLQISTGDELLAVVRFLKDKYIITLLNTTTGKINTLDFDISSSSPYDVVIPNSFRYGIIALGGTHLIDEFSVFSNDAIGVSYLFLGDSITKGFSADNCVNRFSEIINASSISTTQTNAGPGNLITDLNVNEILALAPKNIVLLIGINNIQAGRSMASIQTEYQALVNSLVAGGYILGTSLFLCQLTPYSPFSAQVLTFNNWLVATYGTINTIDFYTTQLNGTAFRYSIDGIHPSNEGHKIMANILINKLNIPSKVKKQGGLYPIIYNANGKVIIAKNETNRSSTPKYLLEIVDSGPAISGGDGTGAQVRFGRNFSDNGGYLVSLKDNAAAILGGMVFDAGWRAKSAVASGVSCIDGDIIFLINASNLTVGNVFTPLIPMYIKSVTGQVVIGNGTIVQPCAQFEVNSSSRGALLPRMTTAQKNAIVSPIEGLEVYDLTLHKKCFYNGTAWETITSS